MTRAGAWCALLAVSFHCMLDPLSPVMIIIFDHGFGVFGFYLSPGRTAAPNLIFLSCPGGIWIGENLISC